MSRYILDINSDIAKSIVVFGMVGERGISTVFKIDELKELTTDYINEHFGDLQDTAYQKGINDGSLDVKQRVEGAYQKGLDEAWKAARRISVIELNGGLAGKELMKIYGTMDIHKIYDDNTASEAIEKLKAYEEKKADDEIKVGDEVERYINGKLDSKGIYLGDTDEEGDYWNCLFWTGAVFTTLAYPKYQFKRTGRHFDIDKILEDMRND